MKVLSVMLAGLFMVAVITWAETVCLPVQCSDSQSQKENGLAVMDALNTWESCNTNREIVAINMQLVYSKTNSRAIYAKSMVTGIILTHQAKPEIKLKISQ